MNPVFLTLEEILEIHTDMLEEYGGAAGIRDLGLLKLSTCIAVSLRWQRRIFFTSFRIIPWWMVTNEPELPPHRYS